MNYRSVLVLHALEDSFESLKSAMLLSNKWNAHIDVCVFSTPASAKKLATVNTGDRSTAREAAADIALTEARLDQIRQFTDKHKIAVHLTNHYTVEENLEELLAKSALYSDLVIMSHGCSLLSGIHRQCLDAALLKANKPVLLTACEPSAKAGDVNQPKGMDHIVIAWHEDSHAVQAIQEAFPLLEAAKKIDLVLIENGSMKHLDLHESRVQLSAIESYLARHSLSVKPTVVPTDGRFVSHALLDTISTLNPDLVIMGAFGHSQLAEKWFHGVTYDVLDNLVHTDLFLSHS